MESLPLLPLLFPPVLTTWFAVVMSKVDLRLLVEEVERPKLLFDEDHGHNLATELCPGEH